MSQPKPKLPWTRCKAGGVLFRLMPGGRPATVRVAAEGRRRWMGEGTDAVVQGDAATAEAVDPKKTPKMAQNPAQVTPNFGAYLELK